MFKISKSGVRLYAITARKSPRAVIFRRGPSKQVQLILWHTDTDTFVDGQWLKGRIYERRCDLSPSGELLIYFAANYKKPYFSWTAISKPPFLTALALWQKGDGWGGGGLFNGENEVLLNHGTGEMTLNEGFELPKHFKVKPFGERSGGGEDDRILRERLTRDGWRSVEPGKTIEHRLGDPLWIEIDPPRIWSKTNPAPQKDRYELRQLIKGIHERNGSWYVIEHVIVETKSKMEVSLGRTDWADWDHGGELVFAKEGKIFRLGFDKGNQLKRLEDAQLLIDLTDRKFEPMACPNPYKF